MPGPFLILLAAIALEVGATSTIPKSRGFHDLPWTMVVLVGYALSTWLLAIVVRQMPVSIAYTIWAGLGTAAVAVVGVVLLGEEVDLVKFGAIALIILGVVVLNLHSPAH